MSGQNAGQEQGQDQTGGRGFQDHQGVGQKREDRKAEGSGDGHEPEGARRSAGRRPGGEDRAADSDEGQHHQEAGTDPDGDFSAHEFDSDRIPLKRLSRSDQNGVAVSSRGARVIRIGAEIGRPRPRQTHPGCRS